MSAPTPDLAHALIRPTGTVTFMFTDIEGSTRLVQELGLERWTPLLERHRAIVRQAIAAYDGIEISTEGDSFFVIFTVARKAVEAAIAVQRGLAEERWPEGAAISVRIGLHSGLGLLDADGSYVGADVHRAARVASAAHGGQVLVSSATHGLVVEDLPEGADLVDLGLHRLKDLTAEHLCQLSIVGLRETFPPIRAASATLNNLPAQLTSFIGREHELEEVWRLLDGDRLLTLTGPGGSGKTRLALQLAAEKAEAFPDGIWFVPLEPIRQAELVASTIAATLGIGLSSGRSAVEIVADWIDDQQILLILDNFEQVIEGAPTVPDLLRRCPKLKILCTSRSVLHVSGEREYEVPGLPAPLDFARLTPLERQRHPEAVSYSPETLSQYESVRLFIARALAVDPDFTITNENAPAVAQICSRLQGTPLAIELAAARVKLLTPQQILHRLDGQLTLLKSSGQDIPERQRTLRGAIAWSYDLLGDPFKELAEKLSVFRGGWRFEAAEAVAAGAGVDMLDGLAGLVDHSLVRKESGPGDSRFEMLPTINEFLAEQLTARGAAAAVSRAHAEFYLALAEEAAPHLHSDDQGVWLDRLEEEHDNMRAALDWACEEAAPELAVRLGFAMWRFWQKRGYVTEARARFEKLVATNWDLPDELKARLLEAAGGVAYWQADHPVATRWYGEALDIWRRIGDRAEIANAIYNHMFAEILPFIRGEKTLSIDERDRLMVRGAEALRIFRELGDKAGEGSITWSKATLEHYGGLYAKAADSYRESLALFEVSGNKTMEAWAQHMMALPLLKLERMEEAYESSRSALRHFHGAGDLAGVAMVLRNLSALAVIRGDNPRAGRFYGAAERLQKNTGADLAAYLEDVFANHDPQEMLTPDELKRYAAEGAQMPLEQLVAEALGDSRG